MGVGAVDFGAPENRVVRNEKQRGREDPDPSADGAGDVANQRCAQQGGGVEAGKTPPGKYENDLRECDDEANGELARGEPDVFVEKDKCAQGDEQVVQAAPGDAFQQ